MDDKVLIDKDIARVLDLLSQIKKLNNMIDLHKNESKSSIMVNQYLDLKGRFLEELKEILSDFGIDVLMQGKTA